MVTSTFLYDIKNEIKENIGVNNIITSIILGTNNQVLSWYDENKIYNRGDIIPFIKEDGTLVMLVCKKDGTTGEFSVKDWEEYNLINELKLFHEHYIELSALYPLNRRVNKVWLQVKSESIGVDIDEQHPGIIIYNNFIISETEPAHLIEDMIWGKVTEIIL